MPPVGLGLLPRLSGWSGSGTVTSSAALIMGVVNEEYIAKTDGDWQYSYNCLAP